MTAWRSRPALVLAIAGLVLGVLMVLFAFVLADAWLHSGVNVG